MLAHQVAVKNVTDAHFQELVSRTLAMVDLPEPESPEKKIVRPCLCRGG